VKTGDIRTYGLDVEPKEKKDNPNHANIVDWPDKKDLQKRRAQLIAATAKFIDLPK